MSMSRVTSIELEPFQFHNNQKLKSVYLQVQ